MSSKLFSVLPAGLLLWVVSIGACGGLTYKMFTDWRNTAIVQAEFETAKKGMPNDTKAMDNLFMGPKTLFLKNAYAPLSADMKGKYETARDTGEETLAEFFVTDLLPSTSIAWGCMAALILFIFLATKVYPSVFLNYSGKMVMTTSLVGIFGGYFAYLAVANIYPMGIDLAGGTELIYRLDYSKLDRRRDDAQKQLDELEARKAAGKPDENGKKILDDDLKELKNAIIAFDENKRSAPEKAAEIVRQRIDPNGTRGIPITKYGEGRLRIQLPKASPEDVARIKRSIQTQGRLTFHLCPDKNKHSAEIAAVKASKTGEAGLYKMMKIEKKNKFNEKKSTFDDQVVAKIPMLEGSRIVMATIGRAQEGGFEVLIRFDSEGARKFYGVTKDNIDRGMAIVLDGKCYSAPIIRAAISDRCSITGDFSEAEALELASVLTAGSLPAEIVLASEFSVGPSLGQTQIRNGIMATLVGALLVALFIWTYYRVGGFISVLCLGVNLTVLMGGLGFFKATMTLPGIAGILLTMGIAVDANVLIFERIREELARGRNIRLAVQHGFDRAIVTILDSQLTTLLSGIILYYLGTGPIRGFAVTLSLGILVTLFANLWVCRNLIEWLVARDAITDLKMQSLFTNTKIDFMKIRKPWLIVSSLLVTCSVLGFGYKAYNESIFDLDFTGGTLLQFNLVEGKQQTVAEVNKEVNGTLRTNIKTRLTSTSSALRGMAGSKKTETELRAELYEKIPGLGQTLFGTTAKVDNESLTGLADRIDKVLKGYKNIKLEIQPSSMSASEGGRYGSFTVTSRETEPAYVEILNLELLAMYAGRTKPNAVEYLKDSKSIRVRFRPDASNVDDALSLEIGEVLSRVAASGDYADIKVQLANLKASPIKFEPFGDGKRAVVDLTPIPEDAGIRRKIQDAIEEAKIEDRAEGAISRKSTFGSQVAGEMQATAVFSALGALAGIFLYLWFRFSFSGAWGIGAIAALFHDALMAIGAVCLFNQLEIFPILIDLNLVAAILTIIGYSVNDTIVTFDRIREIRTQHTTRALKDVVNEAINATLSRTFLTSATTLLAVLSLFLLGGETIRDLSFTLLVGICVGTYSSIFVASPVMMWWLEKYGTGRAPVPGMGLNTPKKDAAPSGAQI